MTLGFWLTSDLCYQACGGGAVAAGHSAGPPLRTRQDERIQEGLGLHAARHP